MPPSQVRRFLHARCGAWECALPLHAVVEVMRPLPLEPLADMPEYVTGVSIIRGAPVPVVDLRRLMGAPDPARATRLVTVRTPSGNVALAVDAVAGIEALPPDSWTALPPLLRDVGRERIAGLAARDGGFLMVLDAARLIPEEVLPRA